jgi:hypothetical protein
MGDTTGRSVSLLQRIHRVSGEQPMSARSRALLPEEEYLAQERAGDAKHESVAGAIRALTGASRPHKGRRSPAQPDRHHRGAVALDRGGRPWAEVPAVPDDRPLAGISAQRADRPRLGCYRRQLSAADGLDALLRLPAIDCALALADVYEEVVFDGESVLPAADA